MAEILFGIAFLAICAICIGVWYAFPYILIVAIPLTIIILLIVRARLKSIKKNVMSAVVLDEKPIIKRKAENTGYTVSYGRGISSHEHYQYRDVITGYDVTFDVVWKDGRNEQIKCKKDSATYNRLIEKTKAKDEPILSTENTTRSVKEDTPPSVKYINNTSTNTTSLVIDNVMNLEIDKDILDDEDIEMYKYIIDLIVEGAKEARDESNQNPDDDFYKGRKFAYYEVLDTIKEELEVNDKNLKEFGLDIDLKRRFLH